MSDAELCVMLVAVEESADALGAGLIQALRRRLGARVRFVGVGGFRMRAEGVESPFDIGDLAIVGIVEGALAHPRGLAKVRLTVELARRERADLVVLIDSWSFSLHTARRLRKVLPDVPLVKYVAPQVWATRPGRARVLARAVDLLLTIHSFDAPWFEREGLKTVFVGNRTLAMTPPVGDAHHLRRELQLGQAPLLLLLPGSRRGEVARLLPPFADAVALLRRSHPKLALAIPVAPTVRKEVNDAIAAWPFKPHLIEGDESKRDAYAAATAALVCSGTATTELAMAGVPMVVAYRLSWVTGLIVRRLLRTRFITLLNVAADEEIVPELVENRCTGPALARAVAALIDDPKLAAEQVAAQQAALDHMGRGGPDPSDLAASAICDLLVGRGRLSAVYPTPS